MSISPGFSPGISTQPVNKGGTGATTASGARSNLGLAASTTDNAICRFDGTSGSTQNSGCTIDDSGNLAAGQTDITGAVNSSIATSELAGKVRIGSRASGRSNVVLDSATGRAWNIENTGTSLVIGYPGLDAITVSETTGNATIGGNLTVSGTQNILGVPASANALTTNSTMTFELTSNTSLTIKVRGTDGTTRSVSLTLA